MDPPGDDAYGERILMNTTMQPQMQPQEKRRCVAGAETSPATRSPTKSRPLPFLGLIPEDSAHGVRIASLAPDSPSAVSGLRPGDLILGLAGRMVTTVAEYTKQLALLATDTHHVVYLQRGRGTMFLSVTPTMR